ncbi:mucosa-associated lymphoid tissue lymphoma translocation protein 1 [Nilaparvata lugens]|uniref:mucosa-associated lymphoid tissue lymphoma translocation protein 1 n=1 Tax=Nilaparvata lugens TaxID=108931 RepID=UPI000B98EF4F|nr:mucosa-associated lymphoid tissue lymphoma translocation protein 1 [Nilaparvata lugens]
MKIATDLQYLSIEELQKHFELYRKLVRKLNTENNWRKILEFLRDNFCCDMSDENFNSPLANYTPAEMILQELVIRDADVEKLCIILQGCDLMDALTLLLEHEPLEITKQPGDSDDPGRILYVKENDYMQLECTASGIPVPTYQWYKDGILLEDQTTSFLLIEEFGGDHCGEYYCCVRQVANNGDEVKEQSNCVTVKQLPEAPVISFDLPRTKTIKKGEQLSLSIYAYAFPAPHYSWYHGNALLSSKSSELLIDEIEVENEGEYRCCIQNKVGELWSKTCKVTVYYPCEEKLEKNHASAKFALLIGNSKYEHYKELLTPENDLMVLTEILKKLNFEVITLQDLSLIEMTNAVKWFCKALPPKAYAFFYFVGHGFKLNNRYMMPVDCPPVNDLCHSDCFSDAFLEKEFMESDTQLIVIVFDMCLKVLKGPAKLDNKKEPVCEYTREDLSVSFLQCLSTSSQLESYETVQRDHGLYFSHLRKFLEKDIPVTRVFQEAHREFNENETVKQKPCMCYDDADRFCLTDPVDGVPELKEKFREVFRIPPKQKLKFKKVDWDMTVEIRPYKGCFLNAVELWLLPLKWSLKLEFNCIHHDTKGMRHHIRIDEGAGAVVQSLFDLQKAKFDLCVSIFLLKQSKSNGNRMEIVDSAMLDLGSFMIMPARLWYIKEEAELQR